MLEKLVEQFLALHVTFHPVDATFMGIDGHDHRLPPADLDAVTRELEALWNLEVEVERLGPGRTSADRLEARMLRAQLRVAIRELEERPRYKNPAWFTGETAFGIISLLLPSDPPRNPDDLRQRLEAIPTFLKNGAGWLGHQPIPADWVTRARLECDAMRALLERGLRSHELWSDHLEKTVQDAVQAIQVFASGLDHHADADPRSGEAHLEFLMREAHGLPYSVSEAEALALKGFETARAELERMAAKLDPTQDWRTQLAALEHDHPRLEHVIPSYERWNETALERADSSGLVTPARAYNLEFRTLPDWAHGVAGALYFLFYRSPAAGRPSHGSAYWVFPPGQDVSAYLRAQNTATIKITHVVHHGSIGHHTQNARARASRVRLGRLAGTDCASGIAMLSGGTMIEGWACYVQDLMLEAEGFYTPLERVLLKQYELRNAAMCLADIQLHRGAWNLAQMRAFYTDEVGVAPGRLWAETTRNSIYPATRLMYWLGTREIKRLRLEIGGSPRAFHDALLSFGSVPVDWVAEEFRARGGPDASFETA
jgi:Bacterial protein of unknown function (DUF885)